MRRFCGGTLNLVLFEFQLITIKNIINKDGLNIIIICSLEWCKRTELYKFPMMTFRRLRGIKDANNMQNSIVSLCALMGCILCFPERALGKCLKFLE